jgi:maltose operon protein
VKSTRHQQRRMSAARIIFLAAGVSVVSACSSLKALEESLSSEKICCSSYGEFQFEPLALDKEVEFQFGAGGQAYSFSPEGKSYFKAVELPKRSGEYEMAVAAEVHGSRIPTSHTFYPKLAFLGENLAVIDSVEPQLVFRMGFTRSFYRGKVPLKPVYRYLVIYTDRSRLGQRIFVSGPGFQTINIPAQPGTPGMTGQMMTPSLSGNRGAGGTVMISLQKKPQPNK